MTWNLIFESITRYIEHHWMLSTYLGTMVLNENAILAAFSLSVDSWKERYIFIGIASVAGVLTNDIILYGVARFGLIRFFRKQTSDQDMDARTFFERVFLKNIFLSLFFMKFLFGIRSVLTLYLIYRKEIPFGLYCVYSFFGILFYVFVLAIFGWLLGIGVSDISGTYHAMMKIFTCILIFSILMHSTPFIFRWMTKSYRKLKLD